MSYLSSFPEKFRTYKGWKKSGKLGRYDSVPSSTYVKYPPNSTFNGKKVLNVGCGGCTYKAPNVVNADLHPGKGVNVVCDLSKPLPFADNTFDLIIANHVLEHVPGWWDCFKELARVTAPNGNIEVWVPTVASDGAFVYRDHINYMNVESFFGTKGFSRPGTNLDAVGVVAHSDVLQEVELVVSCRRPMMEWWIWFAPDWALTWMATYLRNVISEEGYFFKKAGK